MVSVEAWSSVYETEPVGEVPNQPDFLNAVVRVRTDLLSLRLLDACKDIERKMGRTWGLRHAPRPIDIDILLVEGVVTASTGLTVPHQELTARRFVLVPLLEVDPPDPERLREALAALPPGQRVERVGDLFP